MKVFDNWEKALIFAGKIYLDIIRMTGIVEYVIQLIKKDTIFEKMTDTEMSEFIKNH